MKIKKILGLRLNYFETVSVQNYLVIRLLKVVNRIVAQYNYFYNFLEMYPTIPRSHPIVFYCVRLDSILLSGQIFDSALSSLCSSSTNIFKL